MLPCPRRTVALLAPSALLLAGCLDLLDPPTASPTAPTATGTAASPTPSATATAAATPTESPSSTLPGPTPTAATASPTPSASASETSASPTPSPTPTATPTPLDPPCLPPAGSRAVCLDVGTDVYLVDGIVNEPIDVSQLSYFGYIDAVYEGVDEIVLREATTTQEGGSPEQVDLTSLGLTPLGPTTVVDNGDGTVSVLPQGPNEPFGIAIDLGGTTDAGSGWGLGQLTGDGLSQTFNFRTSGSPDSVLATERIIETAEGLFYEAWWSPWAGVTCEIRLYYLGELVTSFTDGCDLARYQILPEGEAALRQVPVGDDPIILGMQDFDVAESHGKIRYTFTGSSIYDFDLP